MNSSREIKIHTLERELDIAKADYQVVSDRYFLAVDPEQRSGYKRRMDTLLKEMDRLEVELDSLKKNHVQNSFLGIEDEPPLRSLDEIAYLTRVRDTFAHWNELYTDIAVMIPQGEKQVRLRSQTAERYVQMQHAVFLEIDHEPTADYGKTKIADTFEELLQEALLYQRVAILGNPGAGKTTTLERMAYALAANAITHESAPVPVFLRLGDYRGQGFSEYIRMSVDSLSIKEDVSSRLIFLMDGLNEIPLEYKEHVGIWLKDNPQALVLITCRKLDYIGYRLNLQRIDVLPLSVTRIYEFIGNYLEDIDRDQLFWRLAGDQAYSTWLWYQTHEPDGTFASFWFGTTDETERWDIERHRLKNFQDDLLRNDRLPGLLGMVSNPFLLFAVIQIYIRKGRHPSNRGQLFHLFVTLLIEQRGRPAAVHRPPWIDEVVQREALARLASTIQLRKLGISVEENVAVQILEEAFPSVSADQLLYLAASAGLISRGETIRFVHQLLQEYFAAFELGKEMHRGTLSSYFWPLDEWWMPTGWEESAILLGGIETDATEVVSWLAPVNPSLAFRVAKESGSPCSTSALALLYEPSPGARISPQARAEWGQKLAVEGDNRPGVGLNYRGLPDIVWCEIPTGSFFMGGDPLVAVAHSRWDGAVIELHYNYWLAKYPITYAQFEAFANSDGYVNDEYWTESGLEWRGSQKSPKYWNDPRWHLPNHPVIGVTWHEAVAFAKWLNTRLDPAEKPHPQSIIRLPTEAEWEKAARFPDDRLFPWGNEYIVGRANLDETADVNIVGPNNLQKTTAVGVYPLGASAIGVHDLSGNVWEWCLSKWQDVYEYPEGNELEGPELRVLRGGSWFYSADFARCASRARDHVGNRDYDLGFRLCASLPIDQSVAARIKGTHEKVFGEMPVEII